MEKSLLKQDLGIDDVVFSRILDVIREGVCFIGRGRKILYWNKTAEKLTGYREDEVLGKSCTGDFLDFVDREGKQYCKEPCPAVRAIAEGITFERKVYLRTKNEKRLPVNMKIMPFRFDGKVLGSLEIFTDITEYENLSSGISTDLLARFPMWQDIQGDLDYEDERVQRYGIPFCLLLVVADQLQNIPDDDRKQLRLMILESLADHLRRQVRRVDLICRHEEDNFAVLMPHTERIGAFQLAERLRASVARSSPSITISQCVAERRQGESVYEVIKRAADTLKISGANQHNVVKVSE